MNMSFFSTHHAVKMYENFYFIIEILTLSRNNLNLFLLKKKKKFEKKVLKKLILFNGNGYFSGKSEK